MKKIIALLLAFSLILSFAACTSKQNESKEDLKSNNNTVIEDNEKEEAKEEIKDSNDNEIASGDDSNKVATPVEENPKQKDESLDKNEDTSNKQEAVKDEEKQPVEEKKEETDNNKVEEKEPEKEEKTKALPSEINGIKSSNLLNAFALPENLYYTNDPKSDNEHINNFIYCYLTGDWEFKGTNVSNVTWKKNIGPLVDKNITLLGAFQNQSNAKVVYINGKYYISSGLKTGESLKEKLYQEIFDSYNKAVSIKEEVRSKNSFTNTTSQYQIAKYYYDYLEKAGFTVDDFDTSDKNINIQRDSAYASLVNKNGACGARAAAYCMLLNLESIKNSGLKEETWQNGVKISGHIVSYIVADNEEWSVDWGNHRGIYKWNAPASSSKSEYKTVLTSLESAREVTGFEGEDLNIEENDYSNPATKADIGVPFELTFKYKNNDGSEVYSIKAVESEHYDENCKYQPWFGDSLGRGTRLNNPITLDTFKTGITVTIRKNSIDFHEENGYPKTVYVMKVNE